MADSRNFAALDWIVTEIDETLLEAQQFLEDFVEKPDDQQLIRECLASIHQVHGSLKMVELFGAVLLVEEMESVCVALLEKRVKNDAEAQEVLMQAILHLPAYLRQVKQQRKENPASLLSILNDLRASRGGKLVSESRFFNPDISPAKRVSSERSVAQDNPQQFLEVLEKLRKMYQYAAAGVIRGVKLEENLGYLEKVFSRLYTLTAGTGRQPLWDIALAVAEGLDREQLDVSTSIKSLMRHLNKEIQLLAKHGVKALDSFPREELIRNLLYYVATSQETSPRIERLRESYKLGEALPELEDNQGRDSETAGPDTDTLRTVVGALNEELSEIKQCLDPALAGADGCSVERALPVMQRVADTLSVLGLQQLKDLMLEQADRLEVIGEEGLNNPSVFIPVADEIIALEHQLASLAEVGLDGEVYSGQQLKLNQAHKSVLQETYSGLEKTKEAIVDYITSDWNPEPLKAIPESMRQITGGLSMIHMSRAASILNNCNRYVEAELLSTTGRPDWSDLDTLADALSGVEYYIERLISDELEDDALLELAEKSIDSLGYGVDESVSLTAGDEPHLVPEPEVLDVAQDVVLEINDGVLETVSDTQEPLEAPELLDNQNVSEDSEPNRIEQHEDSDSSTADAEDDSDDDVDDEIIEIFLEEAVEVLETIDDYFPRWSSDFSNDEALGECRRAFHTLKGSGRMVGATQIGELAWGVESMLNRLIDKTTKPHEIQVELISRVRSVIPDCLNTFENQQPDFNPELISQLNTWSEAIARGELPAELMSSATEEEIPEGPVTSDEAAIEVSQSEPEAETDNEPSPVSLFETPAEDDNGDEDYYILWNIFGSEALSHLQVVDGFIAHMEAEAPLYLPPSEQMQRALHTLKGSAHMADVTPIAELATPWENFTKELRTYQANIDADMLQLFRDGVAYTREALEQIHQKQPVHIHKLPQFKARLAELRDRTITPLIREQEQKQAQAVAPELLSIFMAEEMDLLLDADVIINAWRQAPESMEQGERLINELSKLAEGAEKANLPEMAVLSHDLAAVHTAAEGSMSGADDGIYDLLLRAHEQLLDMVDAIAAGQNIRPADESLKAELDQAREFLQQRVIELESESEPEPEIDVHISEADSADIDEDISLSLIEALNSESSDVTAIDLDDLDFSAVEVHTGVDAEEPVSADEGLVIISDESASLSPGESTSSPSDSEEFKTPAAELEFDESEREIVEIFLEEADELMEDIEQAVHNWSQNWEQPDSAEALKRALHTFKGGARLAGLSELGDTAHNFETDVINLGDKDNLDNAFFVRINQYQDSMLKGLESIKVTLDPDFTQAQPASVMDAAAQNTSPTEDIHKKADDSAGDVADILPFVPRDNTSLPSIGDNFKVPVAASVPAGSTSAMPTPIQTRRQAPQEVVKVSAELLEELVNLAGETSISRGRMEEQVSELGFAIEEMDVTIARLQEQLRRLDIETEAQILFRQERMAESEEFDPLEMDRYSQLQQLSRSLVESASDLVDLKSTLQDKTRDAETLLLQQSRINTDLQEGLMRSRMVPFSRLVPRLRRIVRQVSGELGKRVSFELDNVEGELDRSVLERMIAPLEHMLRNAVDHGIEMPEDRLAAGKPETGRIILTLNREGGDVLLRLIDDGRGINLPRVREKAIERGLMSADATLSERDIMQFILHAGFSTAESVTQISGRGVGMDVVHSEIKQLGGAVTINSKADEGTEFTVRLPFTVSVNRALMVRIGEERYAIPLNTIEGIVRVSSFELEHYYEDPESRFEYAGESYDVRYLGSLLDTGARPKLEGQVMPLPVILVRTAQSAVAIQVDMLMGSREIVVKSLGAQFANVIGLSGATVMGDGSVVVILDPHAMIRQTAALGHSTETLLQQLPVEDPEQNIKTVMVVDDSVTVRKVTSRFLEREGYEVLIAKDGADALMVLQDRVPDLMLLDIEMPRMDGFEVAKNVRSSSRLKDIPIIMITSRTGEKHRDRAFSLGVNDYLGKPYQEDMLLKSIKQLIGEDSEEH